MNRHAIPLAISLLGVPACEPRFESPAPPAPAAAVATTPSAAAPGWVTTYTWVDPIGGGVPIADEYVYVDSAGVAYDRRTGHELRYLEHQNRALERELGKEERQAEKAGAKEAAEMEREQQKLDRLEGRTGEPRHEDERAHAK